MFNWILALIIGLCLLFLGIHAIEIGNYIMFFIVVVNTVFATYMILGAMDNEDFYDEN